MIYDLFICHESGTFVGHLRDICVGHLWDICSLFVPRLQQMNILSLSVFRLLVRCRRPFSECERGGFRIGLSIRVLRKLQVMKKACKAKV